MSSSTSPTTAAATTTSPASSCTRATKRGTKPRKPRAKPRATSSPRLERRLLLELHDPAVRRRPVDVLLVGGELARGRLVRRDDRRGARRDARRERDHLHVVADLFAEVDGAAAD